MEQKDKTQAFGYLLGRICAIVLVGCISGCAIALTINFILWLFGF